MDLKRFFKDYGLSVALFSLFVLTWTGQFFSSTFENWQSKFLQLFTMVVLTSFLSHKGSPESKDSEEFVEKYLTNIDRKLNLLTSHKLHKRK